jgi:hypothetical protein
MAAEELAKIEAGIPDRVWELYFGPKGAIPRLEKTMNTLCLKLDAVASGLEQTQKDMKQYNELRPEIQKCAEAIEKQRRICEGVQVEKGAAIRTNTEWQEKIKEERLEARDEAWHRFKVVTTIISLILAGVGFIVGTLL